MTLYRWWYWECVVVFSSGAATSRWLPWVSECSNCRLHPERCQGSLSSSRVGRAMVALMRCWQPALTHGSSLLVSKSFADDSSFYLDILFTLPTPHMYINVRKMCRLNEYCVENVQSVPKKMGFSGKTAITTFKLIQNAKTGGVLENSGYLLRVGHWDFQNWRRNDWENEAWSCQPPLQKWAEFSTLNIHWLILSAIL